jgi:hypothetical protein
VFSWGKFSYCGDKKKFKKKKKGRLKYCETIKTTKLEAKNQKLKKILEHML